MTKITFARLRFWLFIALIIGMPLSKYPSIALPAYDFTSFRIGLYQVLAVLFVLLCAKGILLKIRGLYEQNKLAFLSIVILALVAITGQLSVINQARSLLLTVSILFLLALVLAGWWYIRYELAQKTYPLIIKLLLYAGIIYGALGLGQFVFGTFSDNTLGIACRGCMGDIFGFPRVNLLAAEPLFLANALLPFFFVSLAVFYKNKSRLSLASLLLVSLTITLTFSRGAYGAVVAGLIVFAVLLAISKKLDVKRAILSLGLVIACALASFGLMIASASWRYRNTPNIAYDTTNTILEHVSLGLLSLPDKIAPEVPTETTESTPPTCISVEEFVSPGLIEASTSDRLGAADLALQAWRSNYATIISGVGAGNLGPYVVENVDSTAPSNLTVYIYYILILAELGIFGLVAFLLIYVSGIWQLLKNGLKKSPLLCVTATSLMIALLVQYGFFGTYINTIYVWLLAGIVLGLAAKTD